MSLFSIQTELSALLDAAEEHGYESAEFTAALDEHIEALRGALDTKAEAYAALITSLRTRADARAAESKRIALLGDSDTILADTLANRLRDAMVACQREKIETTRFKLSVRTNGGSLPVEIENADAIPRQFYAVKTVETVDRAKVREAIESGIEVPGAKLGTRGKSLVIR